jgi:3-oxoadipate enol-lactonase
MIRVKGECCMPFFERGNARIYFEEAGHGDPLITVHGLNENTTYWSLPGVTERLAGSCRVISMDMRGHGRTMVEGDPLGFDAETIGADIIGLADHLKLGRFHLMGHSTGGFASSRLAMKDSSRFAALILTNTTSATSPVPGDPETIRKANDAFAQFMEKSDMDQIVAYSQEHPSPFFTGVMESEKSEELMASFRKVMELNEKSLIGAFIRSFFTDPDPRVDGLRTIQCPVLIIYGDKDDWFIQSSRLMAKEIPGAEIIEYKGAGHLSAFEAPERLASDVMDFIRRHPV